MIHCSLQTETNNSRAIAARDDRAIPLYISIRIEFYNGIVRFLCHSTYFLLVFDCRLQWIIWQKVTCATNKTAELSQKRPRDAPNIWVPWKVSRVFTTHPATFPEICNGLLFRSILRMCVQNLKFVALPVPEIIGGTQKIWAVAGYAHAPFSPKILKGFCLDGPCEYTCQIWSS